jgi:hypothetical protein
MTSESAELAGHSIEQGRHSTGTIFKMPSDTEKIAAQSVISVGDDSISKDQFSAFSFPPSICFRQQTPKAFERCGGGDR